ncbi:hypothetical protein GGX14DRAFT_352348 [Mycena pura]|uniref:C2H2-type domain-containing protein n=1 Tax=Mycena pura TaxID=153505 RepID=A0AAD6YMB1_9AGAR|nr:hypothetical protein GGX14DRAFT_352348 [Mycena pura]
MYTSAPAGADADEIEEDLLQRESREKKHGCTMCHKRFDRPSTLKKHLLVHTGEKAFQCSICARRFGVMSNLNRHIRRCSLREVHTHGSSSAAQCAPVTGKRRRETASTNAEVPAPAPRKRRRRPPSPSRWIPGSLRRFNLLPPEASGRAPVPLSPVWPSRAGCGSCASDVLGPLWDEERDSWDENVGRAPYHPTEWARKRRLPGPVPLPDAIKFGGGVCGKYRGGGGGARRAVAV